MEINEMALNMGEGDLRGLSPGGARPAGKPRPFLAHPRKSAPPPAPRLGQPRAPRCRRAQPRAAQRVSPPRLRSSGGRCLHPARSSGRGALRNPSPAVPRRMHRGSGWTRGGSGAPCARSEFTGPPHHLAHSSNSSGKALGPQTEKFSRPAAAQSGVRTGSPFLAAKPRAGVRLASAALADDNANILPSSILLQIRYPWRQGLAA